MAGGPKAVSRRMTELGFAAIRIDRSETEMARDLRAPGGVARYAADPRDTSTPNAMADLLAAFWKGRDGLSKASHALLVGHMTKTKTGARRIKSTLPAGAALIHKTGTMPGTTNDVGIIISPDGRHHVAIAIFTRASKSEEAKLAEDDIAAIARLVYSELVVKTKR
jgi:beta-lactamase class A